MLLYLSLSRVSCFLLFDPFRPIMHYALLFLWPNNMCLVQILPHFPILPRRRYRPPLMVIMMMMADTDTKAGM